jgi:RNA 3'-terminal phosphate cyclase-like protein
VTLELMRCFGIGNDDETRRLLSVEVKARGARPKGGGVVHFSCPIAKQLKPIDYTDAGDAGSRSRCATTPFTRVLGAGLVKKIRGVAYSTKVSPQVANRMVHSARSLLNNLIPDV